MRKAKPAVRSSTCPVEVELAHYENVQRHVTEARYLGDYKIWLEFNDGRKGVEDLADDLYGENFEALRDTRIGARCELVQSHCAHEPQARVDRAVVAVRLALAEDVRQQSGAQERRRRFERVTALAHAPTREQQARQADERVAAPLAEPREPVVGGRPVLSGERQGGERKLSGVGADSLHGADPQ